MDLQTIAAISTPLGVGGLGVVRLSGPQALEVAGRVARLADGRPVKASYEVKEGDVLELRFGERTVKVEVLSVTEHAGKAEASALYKELL